MWSECLKNGEGEGFRKGIEGEKKGNLVSKQSPCLMSTTVYCTCWKLVSGFPFCVSGCWLVIMQMFVMTFFAFAEISCQKASSDKIIRGNAIKHFLENISIHTTPNSLDLLYGCWCCKCMNRQHLFVRERQSNFAKRQLPCHSSPVAHTCPFVRAHTCVTCGVLDVEDVQLRWHGDVMISRRHSSLCKSLSF